MPQRKKWSDPGSAHFSAEDAEDVVVEAEILSAEDAENAELLWPGALS